MFQRTLGFVEDFSGDLAVHDSSHEIPGWHAASEARAVFRGATFMVSRRPQCEINRVPLGKRMRRSPKSNVSRLRLYAEMKFSTPV